MTEAEWLACDDPNAMTRHILGLSCDEISNRRVGLFMAVCCRRLGPLLSEQSHRVIDLAEQYSEGQLHHEAVEAAWHTLLGQEQDTIDSMTQEMLADLVHDDPWGHADRVVDKAAGVLGAEAMSGVAEEELPEAFDAGKRAAQSEQVNMLRDIFGNPFRPVPFSPSWCTDTAVVLACQMYESRDFGAMPILADALQDAGCDSEYILDHCRGIGPHVRGCWVVDLVLGKE